MKNFNFFLLTVGVFFVYAQKDSSENENPSKASSDKTTSESDPKSMERQIKKYNRQSVLVTPEERLLIDQKMFQICKPGFLEDPDHILPVSIPAGGKSQNVQLTDDSGMYNVQLENFREENSGAISAHIINQKNEEYIPYPPNGDPYNYAAYRGISHAMEPPVIRAYERSSSSNIGASPLVDFTRQSPGTLTANYIYQRSFPEYRNFEPGSYSGAIFSNGASEQIQNSGKINKWYERQRMK